MPITAARRSPPRLPTTFPDSPCQQVAAFDRNRWPLSVGLGDRFPSESLAALSRNP
jgi:hypothetical protein